jgi:hypothetical protein
MEDPLHQIVHTSPGDSRLFNCDYPKKYMSTFPHNYSLATRVACASFVFVCARVKVSKGKDSEIVVTCVDKFASKGNHRQARNENEIHQSAALLLKFHLTQL